MAQEVLDPLITRIQAAARSGDVTARQASEALIALVQRRDAMPVSTPYLAAMLIEERGSSEDEQFARAFQEWVSRYGAVYGSGEVRSAISGSNGNVHGNITIGDAIAARPPGPPFGDDDWDDETTDDNT